MLLPVLLVFGLIMGATKSIVGDKGELSYKCQHGDTDACADLRTKFGIIK